MPAASPEENLARLGIDVSKPPRPVANYVPAVQVGDNPGRREPTTGEINYRNVFRHIHGKGFTGIVGMEHGNSRAGKAGERAVIEAYRAVDGFSERD